MNNLSKKSGGNRKRISKKEITNRKRIFKNKNKQNFSKKILKSIISGGMKLNVESFLKGVNVTLDVAPTDTIRSLKSKVIDKIGVETNNFYTLTYNDTELSDTQKIDYYEIPENSNLMFRRHRPGFKLSKEERSRKSDQHKFGLCCCCDNGIDDRADFHVDNIDNDRFRLMCNACYAYYAEGETDGYVDGSNGDEMTTVKQHTPSSEGKHHFDILGENVVDNSEVINKSKMMTELKKTEIAEQRVCGTGVMWWALNEDQSVCEDCGCLINDERELDLSLCQKCAEESGDWDVNS